MIRIWSWLTFWLEAFSHLLSHLLQHTSLVERDVVWTAIQHHHVAVLCIADLYKVIHKTRAKMTTTFILIDHNITNIARGTSPSQKLVLIHCRCSANNRSTFAINSDERAANSKLLLSIENCIKVFVVEHWCINQFRKNLEMAFFISSFWSSRIIAFFSLVTFSSVIIIVALDE